MKYYKSMSPASSGIEEAAQAYLQRDWSPIPVQSRSKKPISRNWTKQRLSTDGVRRCFRRQNLNVGVLLGEPSAGLVDLDLDCPEAVRLAPYLMPPTMAIFGRRSRPRSHYLYEVDDPPKSKSFAVAKNALLEIRSTGLQTVFPPSVHESGEQVSWEQEGAPGRCAAEDLLSSAVLLAVASIALRRYPSQGSRHHYCLALAGLLAQNRVMAPAASKLVDAVVHCAGDEEHQDRAATVVTTYQRLRSGQPVSGSSALEPFWSATETRAVRNWLVMLPTAGERVETELRVTPKPEAIARVTKSRWPSALSPAAFHGVAGEVVKLIEPYTEADAAALLVQCLAAVGNMIGRGPRFTVEATDHPLNLFVGIVGDTSKARKGTSWGQIHRIVTGVDSEWARNRVVSGLSSGEGLIHAVRDEKRVVRRERPKKGDFDDEDDPGVPDKRLLVVESELASTLRRMEREGNTLAALVRQAWDGEKMGTLTKKSSETATGAHISIIGHVTQDELRRELCQLHMANGFANRFLWIAAKRSKLLPHGGSPPAPAMAAITKQLTQAVGGSRKIGQVTWSAEGRACWEELYPTLSAGAPGMFGAVTGRAEGQVVRLATLYAVLDGANTIGLRHLEAALAVWDYASASARYIFGSSTGNRTADRIHAALQDQPQGLSREQIRELFHRNVLSPDIEDALDLLRRYRLAQCVEQATRGRPRECWFAAGRDAVDAVSPPQ